ncbi:hydroxymethylbilane synthase [Actinomadura sp. 7K534]|uniref:hydroxymethylbilane synthase n=1 Tax=Actinomadura sp. 7K534 TaxID=2530366 RepID=UPI0024428517|nr:hydroxymethylbilane synthase [Actinomadura sp. 7K534]
MSGRPGATGGPLRLGTRKSLMATTQSQRVADLLTERTGHAVELVGVTTQGDVSKALVAQMGGTGVFVNALRDKILSGEVDFAVHSLKDLPTSETPGIALAATPARDDPRDALCSPVKLADLPHGARVGTGSPRRIAQLRALRPDLDVIPIRGNADTRLAKVTDGELDAVVLAHAGLRRIGRVEAVGEVFDTDQMLPAPGQGALALECRSDRADLRELLGTVNDAATRRAVTAERTILAVLEAGCSAPVGTYAAEVEEELHLTATVAAYDGSRQIRLSASGHPDAAEQIGRDLADRLLAQGADQLMGERD